MLVEGHLLVGWLRHESWHRVNLVWVDEPSTSQVTLLLSVFRDRVVRAEVNRLLELLGSLRLRLVNLRVGVAKCMLLEVRKTVVAASVWSSNQPS